MKYTGNTNAAAAVSLLENKRRSGVDISAAMDIFFKDYKRLILENERLTAENARMKKEIIELYNTIVKFDDHYEFSRFLPKQGKEW